MNKKKKKPTPVLDLYVKYMTNVRLMMPYDGLCVCLSLESETRKIYVKNPRPLANVDDVIDLEEFFAYIFEPPPPQRGREYWGSTKWVPRNMRNIHYPHHEFNTVRRHPYREFNTFRQTLLLFLAAMLNEL